MFITKIRESSHREYPHFFQKGGKIRRTHDFQGNSRPEPYYARSQARQGHGAHTPPKKEFVDDDKLLLFFMIASRMATYSDPNTTSLPPSRGYPI